MIDWHVLGKFWTASPVFFSLPKLSTSMPFSLCHYNVSEVVFWEAKVTSQLHILGYSVRFYFRSGGAKVWVMCVVLPRCYSEEFCLCLQGERWLDGQLQHWEDASKPCKPGCCFHWLNSHGQSLLRLYSSSSFDLSFFLLGLKSCITKEFNLCPS